MIFRNSTMEFNIMLNSDLIVTQLESAVLRPKIQTRPKKYYSNSLYDHVTKQTMTKTNHYASQVSQTI